MFRRIHVTQSSNFVEKFLIKNNRTIKSQSSLVDDTIDYNHPNYKNKGIKFTEVMSARFSLGENK